MVAICSRETLFTSNEYSLKLIKDTIIFNYAAYFWEVMKDICCFCSLQILWFFVEIIASKMCQVYTLVNHSYYYAASCGKDIWCKGMCRFQILISYVCMISRIFPQTCFIRTYWKLMKRVDEGAPLWKRPSYPWSYGSHHTSICRLRAICDQASPNS